MNDPRPPEGYWLNAVVPLGPAKAELLKLLREAEPTTYSQVCRDFAVMRAQELCLTYTNDELAVRDGLFVWTVYNFELVTCLRRVLAKTKWRHIWTIMSEAQCAFVDEVEKTRQRRCAQHFNSESPAHWASVAHRPLAGNPASTEKEKTMKVLNVGVAQEALNRLESDGVIPRATIGAAGYGGLSHSIAVELPERFSMERQREVEELIRNAVPEDVKGLPIHVIFNPAV